RKVKCDGGRPACQRCVSTGRVWDGYGIWVRNCVARHEVPVSNPTIAVSEDEYSYFEWFTHRTVIKLPGLFGSSFWDTLLFQACSNEPAVLHAVIALSSA
ncbi:hypothetical protein DL95DRAFT_233000, partial [Leptodontidium sp. 2 PMI_412]